MIKKIISLIYILLLVAMAAATILENSRGTDFVHSTIYGSWWFVALWGLLVAFGVWYIVKMKVRRASILALHLSFVIILVGALLTHLTSQQGMMNLRLGKATGSFVTSDGNNGMRTVSLPFRIKLNRFATKYHDGTDAVADYESEFTVEDGNRQFRAAVSMNHIFSYRSFRFYQASYDSDGKGSTLSVNSDPWGIPVTYTGYGLLFLSLIWMLVDPRGTYRRLLRSPLLRKGSLVLALLMGSVAVQAQSTLPKETAERLGRLCMLYNGRICPVQTYALDFCKKIYGARSYKGLTAEQVLSGWIFYGNEWSAEPFIKVKKGALKKELGLSDYCSLNSLFNPMSGYKLTNYVENYYNGQHDKLSTQAAEIDNKVMLIMTLRQGLSLKMLPYTTPKGQTTWYAPTDSLPENIEAQHRMYIKHVFPLVYEDVRRGNTERVDEYFSKMKIYQQQSAGSSLPTGTQYKAERINNAVPFATVLFMVNLTLGFVALFYFIYRLTRSRRFKALDVGLPVMLVASFLALTLALALRWIISGNIPMGNGYETMLTVAWLVQLIAIILMRRIRIVLVFGFLLSGFFLLVSHINQMDPAIGQIMPVLNSPLLSAHVGVIMTSYALISLTFICGLMGLLLRSHAAELQALSLVFLYPAMATLGIGIFLGAIWANVSWGNYWSWDPKETWALITFMIYAVALHRSSISWLQKPRAYHLYMVLAFLSIIMTYFGVNYFLSGMHSYA